MSIRCRATASAVASLLLVASASAQAPNVRRPASNGPVAGVFAANRYAIFLSGEPVSARYATRESQLSAAAADYKVRLQAAQASVRRELQARGVREVGAVSTLLNAVFVVATPEAAAALESIPGVAGVRPMRRGQKYLNKAIPLMNGPTAWSVTAIGGQNNAGKGMKIGILDTGIDQTNPAFVDPNLTAPGGRYPICTAGHSEDCAYASNKVIVARSYVRQIAAHAACELDTLTGCALQVNSTPDPATSQPDDYSPRDRDGHGTAVASAAAANSTTAAAVGGGASITISGMAPKAYLGNYKIYGSPGVNDYPPEDVWIQAIDDALNDGMDVVNLSSGMPAIAGALDTGAACGLAPNVPCDPLAKAFEAAAQAGLVVVVAAGNSGVNSAAANIYPAYNSIGSPAIAPSVIAVGASNNSHGFTPSVSVVASSAPGYVKNLAGRPSDSFISYYSSLQAFQAPLVDVSFISSDSFACSALPANSLTGSFAFVQRGGNPTACTYATKGANVQAAGAIGMVLYQSPTSSTTWNGTGPNFIEGVQNFNGPIVGISSSDGIALKNYLDSTASAAWALNNTVNPWPLVTIDMAGVEQTGLAPTNTLITFSSQGPGLGSVPACSTCGATQIKPDLVATGGADPYVPPDVNNYYLYNFSGLYMATEKSDPLGELYSATGFVAADGTSFAAPIVAGAAALVKQAHLGSNAFTTPMIRSALINGSNATGVPTDDCVAAFLCSVSGVGNATDVRSVGAGLLDAGNAAQTNLLSEPSNVSFGAVKTGGTLPSSQTIVIHNMGSNPVSLSVTIVPAKGGSILTATCGIVGGSLCPTTTTMTLPQWTNYTGSGRGTLAIAFSGTAVPVAGIYSGSINVSGTDTSTNAAVSAHIPYMFVVASGSVGSSSALTGNIIPLGGATAFEGIAGTDLGAVAIQALDANGIPAPGVSVNFSQTISASKPTVTFRSVTGAPACTPASSTTSVTCATDNYGIAWVDVLLPANTGTAAFTARTAGISASDISFTAGVRRQPTTAGVAEAAQGKTTIAPGSYVALYGSALGDYTSLASTTNLPLSWDGVTVSFDAPSAGLSVPGYIQYVSPSQINVQAPWELQSLPSGTQVSMKATINETEYGNVVTVPLSAEAPAFFETSVGQVAALIANTFTFVTPGAPVQRGQAVQLYANGLGAVNNQPASGVPAAAKTSTTKNAPTVTIGGISAPVSFSGLAPGTPALYEVDVTVPAGLSAAGSYPVVLTINGKTATSNIQVK
jgi:minor extracellular serine protease Vpr